MPLQNRVLEMGDKPITGVADATADDEAVNKGQMDAAIAAGIDGLAPLASPVFTGNPTAPTPSASDNDTSIATTAFVQTELADYAPLASPAFTGTPTAPTASPGTNSTQIATTAYADAAGPTDVVLGTNRTTTSTSYANVTGLTFSVAANTDYIIDLNLFTQGSADELALAVNGPSGATVIAALIPSQIDPTAYGAQKTAFDDQLGQVGASTCYWRGAVHLSVGGTAGTFSVRFKLLAGSATATVYAGSFLRYKAI